MTGTCLEQEGTAARAPSLEPPFISVIVPVRNEAAFIRRTLDQLLAQDYDPARFEVLIADGRSTDATPAIVREVAARHPQVRLLDNPKCWSSAGRNVAVRAARGDILVVIDGHCDLGNSRHLRELADAFDRSGADCVGRPQPLDVSGATVVQRAVAAARSSWLGHQPASFIYSGTEQFVPPQSVAVAYRRTVFETVGLFDEAFDACEDVELNHRVDRAGLRCFFTPRVAVHYHPRADLRGLFFQMLRYGRGRVRLLRKHPETMSLPCFAPAVFLLGVVIGPLLALHSLWLAGAYGTVLGLYAGLVALAAAGAARKAGDWRILPWLPLVFVTVHAGAGAGILQELATGRRPTPTSATLPSREQMPRRAAA